MNDTSQTRTDSPVQPKSLPATTNENGIPTPRSTNAADASTTVIDSPAIQLNSRRKHLRSDAYDATVSVSLPCHLKVKNVSASSICVELPIHAKVRVNDEIVMTDEGAPRVGIVRWLGSADGQKYSAGLEWK